MTFLRPLVNNSQIYVIIVESASAENYKRTLVKRDADPWIVCQPQFAQHPTNPFFSISPPTRISRLWLHRGGTILVQLPVG